MKIHSFILMIFISCMEILAASGKENSPIGYWSKDNHGLPCFNYTGELPAKSIRPDGKKAKVSEDPWFLLGNYQLTLFTHASGEYEIITGQRSWGRMNQGTKPNSGVNSSVLYFLDEDGKTKREIQLTGINSVIKDPKSCEKKFGCGFAEYNYKLGDVDIQRTLSVAPSMTVNGGYPAFLLTVTIKNNTRSVLRLNYEESVLANYECIKYQRQHNNPIKFEINKTVDSKNKLVIADFIPKSSDPILIPSTPNEMSMFDAYPPSLFIKLESEGEVSYLENNNLLASSVFNLRKGEERTIRMFIGFTFDKKEINQMAEDLNRQYEVLDRKNNSYYRTTVSHLWKQVLPELDEENDETLRREMRWHAYNLEAMTTYSTFYEEAKIPQGTIYDYYWGQHASSRDNYQHALPLVYYNPNLAKSVMRYMSKRTSPWGEMRIVEYGNGFTDNMVYKTSDSQLFFFLLVSEYLRVTKDYDFLNETVDFFPKGGGSKGTIMDCIKNSFIYLSNNIGLGSHGLIKLLNSDWNDNIYVSKNSPYNKVLNLGESHMNTTMALSILENLIPSLKEYRMTLSSDIVSKDVENVIYSMSGYRQRLYDAFIKDLGDRTFTRRMYFENKPIGDDNMFLEPQGYMLQMDDLSVERKRALYNEIKTRLYDNEKLGARQQQTPELGGGHLEAGSRENGGFWYALNGPVIVGLSDFDKDEAKRLLKMMTFDNYSKQFPQYWTSYWSASDNIESSLMGNEEGLPDQSIDYAAIPVYCAHPHAWILYCYYILNEK